MIYEHLKKNNISNIGCVVILDDTPHLFIKDGDTILEGIPLSDEEGVYDGADYNDIILVGVNVIDDSEIVSPTIITDENVDKLRYNIIILYVHTLITKGLVIEDIIDLGFFDILFDHVIKEYENRQSDTI